MFSEDTDSPTRFFSMRFTINDVNGRISESMFDC